MSEELDEPEIMDSLFRADGHWAHPPADWGNPEYALHQVEFFRVLEACVDKLPDQQGRVFMMREWLDLDVDEIRRAVGISATNYWVLMHRARLRLRECLEINWFATGSSECFS